MPDHKPTVDELGPTILDHLYRLADQFPGLQTAVLIAQARAEADYWRDIANQGGEDGIR